AISERHSLSAISDKRHFLDISSDMTLLTLSVKTKFPSNNREVIKSLYDSIVENKLAYVYLYYHRYLHCITL
ncbi:hypothetical protein ACUCLE_005123, partial [Escherichia coli]